MDEKNNPILEDKCEINNPHDDKVSRAKSLLPDDDMLFELSEFFKLFGDSTRIKILEAINGCELCVCDISEVVGVSQSGVSHQLRVLRQNRLVKATKVGKETYYALDDDHIGDIIKIGMNHINERRGNL
ncbi:MAG: helix-turn-helix transcriptional regulator [Oscillospiraceae bacterium]|nr:helix-turn-helix transcriptional regulator [Oscillospiraceae bacterium]